MGEKCALNLFTWSYVQPDDGGTLALNPICPQHPDCSPAVLVFGGGIVVLCEGGKESHIVGSCSRSVFEAEREIARRRLAEPR